MDGAWHTIILYAVQSPSVFVSGILTSPGGGGGGGSVGGGAVTSTFRILG